MVLAKNNWSDSKEFAQKALGVYDIIAEVPQDESQSRYLLVLGRAEQHLNQYEQAIEKLEKAKEVGNPEDDPQLYLDILKELHQLYFHQKKDYIKAFEIKQYQRSIEQQYGFRAFISAGRIQPQRQTKLALIQTESQDYIAPEIAASGRQQDVANLIERIGRTDHKLIVIHSKSGVGKSSLINAGLMPELNRKAIGTQNVIPILIRVYTNWIEELGKRLNEYLEEPEICLDTPLNSATEILEKLHQCDANNWRVVLILDQFEEFFFVCKNPQERREFFEFLGKCLIPINYEIALNLRLIC